jgi:lysozyme
MPNDSNQHTSLKGLEFTGSSEGLRLHAYQDTGGVWTIGYGHTKDVKEGDTCTKEQALQWLSEDLQEAERIVHWLVKVPLTQGQFDALVDFVFNLGGSQFASSTLLKQLNGGLYEAAAEQFKRWVYDNGKVQPGLVKRAYGRKQMFVET